MAARLLLIGGACLLLTACGERANDNGAPAANDAAGTTAAVGEVAQAQTGQVNLEVPAGVYKLDPNHALLQWSVSHLGLSNYTAKFTKYDATVTIAPEGMEKSRIVLSIDPRSVRTDFPGDYAGTHKGSPYKTWDDDLALSDKFLNGAKFPLITFTSTHIERAGPNLAKVTGDLNFLGQTKPVTMNVSVVGQSASHPMFGTPVIGFRAEGKFNRSDFGMEKGPIGDEVTVVFDAEFHPAPAAETGAQ